MSQGHEGVVFVAGADDRINRGYDAVFLIYLAVLLAAQADGVDVVLFGKAVRLARAGQDDGDVAVKVVFFVGDVDGVVGKGPEEHAFAELQYLNRAGRARIEFAYIFHRSVLLLC